jgi:hypothetical protein
MLPPQPRELRHSIHQAIVKGRQSLPPAAHGSSPSTIHSQKAAEACVLCVRGRGGRVRRRAQPQSAESGAHARPRTLRRAGGCFELGSALLLPLDSPWGRIARISAARMPRSAHSPLGLRDLPDSFVRTFYKLSQGCSFLFTSLSGNYNNKMLSILVATSEFECLRVPSYFA